MCIFYFPSSRNNYRLIDFFFFFFFFFFGGGGGGVQVRVFLSDFTEVLNKKIIRICGIIKE